MKTLFTVTAVIESAAAFGLMMNPTVAVMHLTGFSLKSPLASVAVRGGGVLLLVLAVGCWLMRSHAHCAKARHLVFLLLAYNGFVTVLLAIVRDPSRPWVGGSGMLLHATMTVWCLICVFCCSRTKNYPSGTID